MAQSSGEGKQTTENLLKLAPGYEGPKCGGKHGNDTHSEFDAIEKSDVEVRER